MNRSLILALTVLAALSSSAEAQKFDGILEFVPAGCEVTRNCVLKNDFGFIDASGQGFLAKAGDKTDGASIPDWAQPFIGKPFEANYIRAAVIHDHYCDRRVHTWLKTHGVFYEALRASGVEEAVALAMYYAVLVGGPKWIELIRGKPCGLGTSCVFEVKTVILPSNGKVLEVDDKRFYARSSRFDDPKIQQEIKAASDLISEHRGNVSRDQLLARAKNFLPGDVFLNSGSTLTADAVILSEIQ